MIEYNNYLYYKYLLHYYIYNKYYEKLYLLYI